MEQMIFNAMRFLMVVPIALVLGNVDMPIVPLAVPLILVINIYMLYASRKNDLLLVISFIIAYCNYSILYANFICPIDAAYTSTITLSTTYTSLNVLLLFNCFLILMVRWDKVTDTTSLSCLSKKSGNNFFFFLIVAILVFIFIYGFTRPSTLGQRGSPKPIYEYSLAFFIILFYFWGRSRRSRQLGLLFLLVFALQNFVFGGRILGIQFLLCAFFMLYMNKLPKRTVIITGITFLLIMTAIGHARGAILLYGFNVMKILTTIIRDGFVLDTAYSSYYTSETFIYCHDLFSYEDRIQYLIEFVKGIFVGANPKYIPQTLTHPYVLHSYGGVLPHFLYFYIGNLGVLIGAVLVSIYLNLIRRIKSNTNGFLKVMVVFVTCHTFRWYLYTPLGLLRGVLFLAILYIVFNYFVSSSKKYKNDLSF